jgi:hypothetical protein
MERIPFVQVVEEQWLYLRLASEAEIDDSVCNWERQR